MSPIPGIPSSGIAEIVHGPPQCAAGVCTLAETQMCCSQQDDLFARYLVYAARDRLTAKQKFILAERNVRDPFNLLTIGGEAAITTATDSHTAEGPGLLGFAKYAGVSLTEDVTGEFLGTFLIPSLAHQDPHYHRTPNLPIKARVLHVIDAVVIAKSDDGEPMFNYATVFGTIGGSAMGNLYVPGRENSWGASAARVAVALATDPIGNAIAEFLPDVARRININIVLVQRVINRIAIAEGAAPSQ